MCVTRRRHVRLARLVARSNPMPIETKPDTLAQTAKKSDSMAETRRVPPGKQPAPQRPAVAKPADKPVMPPGIKYAPYLDCYQVNLPDRTWPGKRITTAPI